MSTQLLICDDSNLARKQVSRSLPDDWDVDISYATNGAEAIDAIKAGQGDVLLLDLNMPVMDGYQVLEQILKQDLPTLVVVISGDIQAEAHQRVTSLGALDFIKKPVSKAQLTKILRDYGIFSSNEAEPLAEGTVKVDTHPVEELRQAEPEPKPEPVAITEPEAEQFHSLDIEEEASSVSDGKISPASHSGSKETAAIDIDDSLSNQASTLSVTSETNTSFITDKSSIEELDPDLRDCYQEIANVAMGQAGSLLARLLDVFVLLPIPNVNLIEVSELSMALSAVEATESTSGLCQGFIGAGISGEALLILNDSNFKDIASLMNYTQELDNSTELELLMDLGNVLIGACLNGISEQLDMKFSQAHPIVLGQHRKISELIASNISKWQRTLAIEISYSIENYPIKFDLLLLLTEKSMITLNNKVSYLLD